MTSFKISYDEIKELQVTLSHFGGNPELVKKLKAVMSWMELMPEDERYVYLLGRK